MTPDDQLDTVLRHLDNDLQVRETFTEIIENIGFDISDKDLELLIDKLVIDGHVQSSTVVSKGISNGEKFYSITFQGRLFLSRGGYHQDTIILKRKNNWTTAKTIAATLNAIIIILIAAFTAWVSWALNEQEVSNKQDIIIINNRLDKQVLTDSLIHPITPTKKDTTK